MTKVHPLHVQALEIAGRYKKSEAELLEVICRVYEDKVFLSLGYKSISEYCLKALKLPEGTTFNLIGVAKKSFEVPELKIAVSRGELSVSTANKITSVITPENQRQWIKQAQELPRNLLEREVARVNPKAATPERASYVSETRIALKLGLSEDLYKMLKRVQDLESKRQRKSVSIEEVLAVVIPEYLEKNDPVIKAERAAIKAETVAKKAGGETSGQKSLSRKSAKQSVRENRYSWEESLNIPYTRSPLRAHFQHAVNLRDRGLCKTCGSSRFTEMHHLIPVSHGGTNELVNLETLCSGCHRLKHYREAAPAAKNTELGKNGSLDNSLEN